MSFEVELINTFKREAKWLIKKYPSLKQELADLLISLQNDPFQGTLIGRSIYKIRIAIASKGKGKSGGARIIINVLIKQNKVFVLSIYDKSEKENISDSEIQDLLKEIAD